MRKSLTLSHKVVLFNSRLHVSLGKIHSRWSSPFIVHIVFPYKAIKLKNPNNSVIFKVNSQRYKVISRVPTT